VKYRELVRDAKEMRKKSRAAGSKRLFRRCVLDRRYPEEGTGWISDGHTSTASMYQR